MTDGDRVAKIKRCAEAVAWALQNVDELKDDLVKGYVIYIKNVLEDKARRREGGPGQSALAVS